MQAKEKFLITSPADVAVVLYDKLKLPYIGNPKTKGRSTSKDVLKQLTGTKYHTSLRTRCPPASWNHHNASEAQKTYE